MERSGLQLYHLHDCRPRTLPPGACNIFLAYGWPVLCELFHHRCVQVLLCRVACTLTIDTCERSYAYQMYLSTSGCVCIVCTLAVTMDEESGI